MKSTGAPSAPFISIAVTAGVSNRLSCDAAAEMDEVSLLSHSQSGERRPCQAFHY
jgi:hypothetical protein